MNLWDVVVGCLNCKGGGISKIKNWWEHGVPLWCHGLRIWHHLCNGLGHCHGSGSIPSPWTSTCCGCGQKKLVRTSFREKNVNRPFIMTHNCCSRVFYWLNEPIMWDYSYSLVIFNMEDIPNNQMDQLCHFVIVIIFMLEQAIAWSIDSWASQLSS